MGGSSLRFNCIKRTKRNSRTEFLCSLPIWHQMFQLHFENASILQRGKNMSFDSRFCARIYAQRCRLKAHQSLRFEASIAAVIRLFALNHIVFENAEHIDSFAQKKYVGCVYVCKRLGCHQNVKALDPGIVKYHGSCSSEWHTHT